MHNNDSSPSTFSIAKGILSTKVSTFAPILGIFFFVFALAIIKNFYDTNRLATRFGEQAIT
ncbi:cyclic diguanylate phosphodiesterase, partial [Vibrio anguillarum]|nr:cyclic diguanylate phosphodiesterase [Vibrio anguillarum]MBF4359552.1 cyclic diguanylate phosphodiesterase [Vibrio anguillarum]